MNADGSPSDPSEAESRKVGQPQDEKSSDAKKESSATGDTKLESNGKPKDKSSQVTPDGEKSSPAGAGFPSWMVGLPPQVRDQIVNGDPEKVPPAYREMIARYHRWLADRSNAPSR